MKPSYPTSNRTAIRSLVTPLLLIAAGVLVGWPTLDGGYLSGDDEQLVVNHALVNHPSLNHALNLFTILHRDLYQPLPLLTFQIEFAVHGGRLALLHLTNILIHTACALLVWRLLTHLAGGRLLPALGALLFIVHPLNMECVAWLNGRMIMLSTAFTLIALLAFDRWTEGRRLPAGSPRDRGWRDIFCIVSAAVAAMISKAWMALPFLLLLLPLWRRYRPDRLWWAVWAAVAAVTGGFVWLNIGATDASGMFAGAEKQLHGPVIARMVLALGWYITHALWPVGLSPYYAPPKEIAWTDPGVLLGLLIIGIGVPVMIASWRQTRITAIALAWFLIAVGPGLLTVMARNLMVADRYTYLANIGLFWVAAHWITIGLGRFATRWRLPAALGLAVLLGACAVAGYRTGTYYRNDEAKIARVLERFPDHPTLLTTSGWFHFERGDYEGAIAMAEQELARFGEDPVAYYRAKNLRAIAGYYRSGDTAAAERDLQDAIQAAPDYAKSYYRLGLIYHDQGQLPEAVAQLQIAIAKAPTFNPALNLLARIYRDQRQLEPAAELYERSVDSARGYDVEAINALGEIDIERGQYEAAVRRYRDLLSWHPRDVRARINLALALRLLGRSAEAAAEYDQLLVTAPDDLRVLVAATDYLRADGRYRVASEVWKQALAAEPHRPDLRGWTALHAWYVGDLVAARRMIAGLDPQQSPIVDLVRLLLAVREGRQADVLAETARFDDRPVGFGAAMSVYTLEALEFASQLDPDSPWPYYVTAAVLLAQRQFEMAEAFREGFAARSQAPEARRQLNAMFDSAGAGNPHE